MKRQHWSWLGLSLAVCAACGDDGSSGNELGTNIGNATGTPTGTDAEASALKSDAAASAEAQQACVQFAALLCSKVTDCASTDGTLSDQALPASLSACQSDTEASLGCGTAKYISPGYAACEDAISASACADALSIANLPDQCSGVIVAP